MDVDELGPALTRARQEEPPTTLRPALEKAACRKARVGPKALTWCARERGGFGGLMLVRGHSCCRGAS